jgi:hypothetical protein
MVLNGSRPHPISLSRPQNNQSFVNNENSNHTHQFPPSVTSQHFLARYVIDNNLITHVDELDTTSEVSPEVSPDLPHICSVLLILQDLGV